MIGEQNSQDGTKNVSTKVPVWVAELLNIICASRGTDIYGLLKLVLEFIIETAKVSGPVPPQMQTILHMLKMDVDWNRAFAFSDPTAQMDVAQVILILQQHDGKQPRKGFGLAMIDKPFMGHATYTTCVDDILERVAEVSMKGLYKMLRMIGVHLESQSLRETLTIMCDAQSIVNLEEQDRNELPGYGDRHDYGKAIEYGRKFKRKPRRTPDSLANSQQSLLFDDFSREFNHAPTKEWEGEQRGDLGDELLQDRPFESNDDV